MSLGIHAPCFFSQARVEHFEDSAVDAVEKLLSWKIQPDFHDAEWALLDCRGAQLGIRLAGFDANLDGMRHALHVFQIDLPVVCRI